MRYEKYWIMESEVNTLYNQSKYKEALTMLEKSSEYLMQDEYEKYEFNIRTSKAIFFCLENRFEEALNIMESLVSEGLACDNDIFNMLPMKENIRYIKLKEKNNINLEKARKEAKSKFIVHAPKDYTSEKKYPLFIALHGDPGSIDEFSQYWKPDEFLNNDFVFVYIQSSQLAIQNGYGWTGNLSISRNEIKECYKLILEQYSIDHSCVLIGGFSGGAMAAMEVTMCNDIPIKGVIVLGPDLTESFNKENVRLASKRGVKAVLMEGEVIMHSSELEEIINTFEESGLLYKFIVNKGIGHAVPRDLSCKLSEAIQFICS
ncbi:alpha/beta hydrolase [Clostridium sp. UBA4548]|uniref:alpha/beta hydrolase n=1 Tax=Clostridium sp. UBA4548 TaxID=1946361 RepID=UPI0025B84FE8|nr:hypothetical protein [Clostridium sp. UBA4548]